MLDQATHEQMRRLLTSYWLTQILHVAARLGLADLLKEGPRSADDLAAATRTHPRSLYRLLRALASVGVFAEEDRHRFSLTPLADCLRSDVPGSLRAMAIMCGEERYQAWGELLHSVRTGQPGFEKLQGQSVFDFLHQHPEQARVFDEAMAGLHDRETAAMLDAQDFTGVQVLADIGGGNGSMLGAVLQRYPAMRGLLFELPGVIERAQANLQALGLAGRCRVIGGDFFASVPAGADTYSLRHVLHNWSDEKATLILKNIHQALGRGGRLLVVESVIPPGNEPVHAKLLDLAMLVMGGGQERTGEEFQRLYEAAGFRLTRIVPTAAEVSVIEGVKA
jgi:hypothetical protein